MSPAQVELSARADNWKRPKKGKHFIQSLPSHRQVVRQLDDHPLPVSGAVLILEQVLVQQLTDFLAGADLFLLHGLLRTRFSGLKGNGDSIAQGGVEWEQNRR